MVSLFRAGAVPAILAVVVARATAVRTERQAIGIGLVRNAWFFGTLKNQPRHNKRSCIFTSLGLLNVPCGYGFDVTFYPDQFY